MHREGGTLSTNEAPPERGVSDLIDEIERLKSELSHITRQRDLAYTYIMRLDQKISNGYAKKQLFKNMKTVPKP